MKEEILIVIGSICLVLFSSFLLVSFQPSFTGYVVLNDSSLFSESIVVTRELAVSSINESQQIIKEMQANNFSIIYMNDTLIEANQVLIQVDYAEILKNSTNKSLITEATTVLQLINWKNLTYSSVLEYTSEIKDRKIQAFEIYDSFTLFEVELEKYTSRGIDVTKALNLLNDARAYFYQDRYADAEYSLKQAQDYLETHSSELSISQDLQRSTKGFILNYWPYIFLVIFLFCLITFFSNKIVRHKLLVKKIARFKAEREVLTGLIKKAQIERFKDNQISGLTYNIRIKKYKEKLEQIKQDLPVLENKIKRFINK